MILILCLISILLFNSITWYGIAIAVLNMVARCAILKKCGMKKHLYGAIPVYGEYLIARCVGHEADGFTLAVLSIIYRLVSIASYFTENTTILTLFVIAYMLIIMLQFVYYSRIYSGMCDLFGRKRRWVILLAFASFVVMPIWGFSKKFQPQWQLEEVDAAVNEFFSTAKAEVMEQGLTVNLKQRTAKELFKTKTLLRDIHMYIKPGSMVLLLGGSGAGKTTLLNAINGYEPADAEIHLNGGNVYSDYKRMQYDIGFVPQLDLMRGSDTVLHTLTDAATLRLPSEMHAAQRKERIEEVMTIFGLKPVAGNMVSKLSGGQRKRLSIAMEFLSNPSLFILDEPDSGLDGVMARELMQQLRNIANQGKIVIVITHTPDRVIDLFDDVIVLAKDKQRTGRLAYYGSISDAREFFGKDTMEHIVLSINRKEEGGEGRADEFVEKYVEVMQHA